MVIHDGIDGERTTPTGAAILRHLAPDTDPHLEKMVVANSGTGFGTKEFEQLPNILRAIVFHDADAQHTDQVTAFGFEVDDQTPEDLAIGLDKIRESTGVLDVTLCPVMSKNGRQAQQVQVLGTEGAQGPILDACFGQTTTLGVRYHDCQGRNLKRAQIEIGGIGVKISECPAGRTAKAEIADLAAIYTTAASRTEAGQNAVVCALSDNDAE